MRHLKRLQYLMEFFLYKILPGYSLVCLTDQYDWHRPDWQYLSTNIVMTILGYHIFLLTHMNICACKKWMFLWTFLWKNKFPAFFTVIFSISELACHNLKVDRESVSKITFIKQCCHSSNRIKLQYNNQIFIFQPLGKVSFLIYLR